MLQKTKAIVLHYIRYGDTSIIAHMYTEMHGRQSVIVSGARSRKSKIKLNMFQPLTLVDMEIYYKPALELHRIKELQYSIPFYHIASDIKKSSVALFIAELLYKTLHEAETNPDLFNFLWNAIQIIEMTGKEIANYHLAFMLEFSKHLGIFPTKELQDDKLAGTSGSGVITQDLADSFFFDVDNEGRRGLELLYKCPFQHFYELKFDHKTRNLLLEHLINYYSLNFENLGHFKSVPVLQEIFR